jgi:DNA-binding NtrC family response regulator
LSEAQSRELHTILVVDDARSARIVAARLLVQRGYEVIPAADVETALYLIARKPTISVIVADWGLQGGDGLTLLKLVGKWYPKMGRILWTGHGCEGAHELGIPCVDKGARGSELTETVRLVISQLPAPEPA